MDEKFSLPAAGSGQCAQNPAIMGKKYEATGRDRLLLPLTLAGCTLAADSFLLHGLGLGVTVTVLAWYALLGLRLGWGRLTAGSGKWLLAANILLGLWYALGSGWYFRLWNFGALAILLPLHAAGYSGEARLPWRRPAMLRERLCLILSGLFGDLGAGFLTLGSFRSQRWDGRKAAGVLFGCAGALALLALLVPTLLRADALFAREMGTLFTWELPELRFPQALAIGLALTPFACSLLWRLAHPRAGKAAEAEREPRLPAAVFLVSLVTLDGLYALFLGVQSAGLFGGPAYLAERGLGYAEWARSGFFQMVRVTVVNLSVLLGDRHLDEAGAGLWGHPPRGGGADGGELPTARRRRLADEPLCQCLRSQLQALHDLLGHGGDGGALRLHRREAGAAGAELLPPGLPVPPGGVAAGDLPAH